MERQDIYESESLTFILSRMMKLRRSNVHLLLRDQEVYPGQPPLLFHLSRHEGHSQKEIAQHLQLTPATVTVMLKRMEKTGHVERRPDPQDQRISRAYLTDKGREALSEVKEAMNFLEIQCFQHISEEEKRMMRRLLLQMYDNMKSFEQSLLTEKDQPNRK
ncbi:MarR family winged helix-turn-helix transcriptional regulator [Paenibacillus rigui]|uniref:MarR family transcriptional regulator n=1 Tax=Paenibacillus rigui TaxID=554312 RepID=A0A229UJK0_9BACL|nr:MarR family transcriptional regulator [Paenibacillus rigui]OXM83580.1 MarR family transcriptional regulator [Paenibacillus rigui]